MTDTQPKIPAASVPLPQLGGGIFLTDGGLETTLIFHDGVDLRCFAAIDMLRKPGGREQLDRYFERYIAIARDAGTGFILESVTWRASPDWTEPLGMAPDELEALNGEAIVMLQELREKHRNEQMPLVVSGCIGPRGDGYDPGKLMTAEEAERYHAWQAGIFAGSGADMITAMTITNIPEAIGIVAAARNAQLPVAISFTVETDGRLPTGDLLGAAIAAVDEASGSYPAYYMINCAHPSHFAGTLASADDWIKRIGGIRANASRCSHAELDEATELDSGDPQEFASEYEAILFRHPQIKVLGGCCGTDHRHLGEIAQRVGSASAASRDQVLVVGAPAAA